MNADHLSLTPDVVVRNETALSPENREAYINGLQQMHAKRIWIWTAREQVFRQERSQYLDGVRQNIEYFHSQGLEVGLWFTSIGFGNPPGTEFLRQRMSSMTRIRSVIGKCSDADAICPTDEDFSATYMDWIRDVARLGAELLMLDDELCLSVRPGLGCFCPTHLRMLSERLGEELVLETLPEKIFTGGKNRYRDTWYQVMGDTLRDFCRKVRAAADEVNPDVRIGFAAGYTSWDIEGVDAMELTRILAGNTKPFVRMTSAPYWVTKFRNRFPGQKLNSVIESARLQSSWLKDSEIEFFAEGDSWPRPCYNCPASYLEMFDVALRANGVRLLKYVFDYDASADYEQGYLRQHIRNLPLYDAIEKAFSEKQPDGVRLFRNMHTICDEVLPQHFVGDKNIMRLFFSPSAAMLSAHGIPIRYEGEGSCAAVFGSEANAVPQNHSIQRMIVDFEAARILAARGVDMGFDSFTSAPMPTYEQFATERLYLEDINVDAPFSSNGGYYQVQCKPNVRVLSWFVRENNRRPASYIYDSGKTSYLVFTFDALSVGESSSIYASYCRREQLLDFIHPTFPHIERHNDIYCVSASSADRTQQAVLFENLSCDPVFDFRIELERPCRSFKLTGVEGELSEDHMSIRALSDFVPFSALLLELNYEEMGSKG